MTAKPETRIIDATGGAKGQKLARYSLIPAYPLDLLAEHYGRGADKYTRPITSLPNQATIAILQACQCGTATVTLTDPTKLGVCAATAMRNGFEKQIQSMPPGSGKTMLTGLQLTKADWMRIVGPIDNGQSMPAKKRSAPDDADLLSLDSLLKMRNEFWPTNRTDVPSAGLNLIARFLTSTMTLVLEDSEASCAANVTKVLDSWETTSKVLSGHLPTCGVRTLIVKEQTLCQSGADNWRLGYDWRLSFDAMMRHAWAFWGGEDIDPETGSPHLVAAAWHCFSLLEYRRTNPEKDTRWLDAESYA